MNDITSDVTSDVTRTFSNRPNNNKISGMGLFCSSSSSSSSSSKTPPPKKKKKKTTRNNKKRRQPLVVVGDELPEPKKKRRTTRSWWFSRRTENNNNNKTPPPPPPPPPPRETPLKEETTTSVPECEVCFEEAKVRTCCGAAVCTHCYASRGHCPACGVGIMRGMPVTKKAETANAAKEEETTIDDRLEAGREDEEEKETPTYAEMAQKREAEALEEHVECRICLDPGVKRKCCGGCFCDACYYRTPKCPACRAPTARRGLGAYRFGDPGAWPVLLGGCVSATAVCLLVGLSILAVFVERDTIRTLHGFKCYGYFPRCDRFACVEIADAPWGDDELELTNMATWTKCGVDTMASLKGSTCVFDWDLWVQSGHSMGYDFCEGSTARDQKPRVDGDEARGYGAKFTEGAYIFGDEFELDADGWQNATSPKSNRQKFALWQYVDGAEVDDACGAHNSRTALHFFGPVSREAVTLPLDVRHGGLVNFRLKHAPTTRGGSAARCRANYGRYASLYYRTASQVGWTQFASMESHARTNDFVYVTLEIPVNASTTATQFKISQPSFEREADHWAIDDFEVFRRFASSWEQQFKGTMQDSQEDVRVAQCCFHTDQCEDESRDPKSRRANAEFKRGCDAVRSKVVPEGDLKRNMKDAIFRLNGAYLYVSLAGLAAFYAASYWVLRTYLTRGVSAVVPRWIFDWWLGQPNRIYVSADDDDGPTKSDYDGWGEPNTTGGGKKYEKKSDVNLERVFEVEVDEVWQRRFAATTVTPLAAFGVWALAASEPIILYTPLKAYHENTGVAAVWAVPVPSVFVFVLAAALDTTVLFAVAKHVVCLLPRWVPMIHLNMHPEKNCLDVGNPLRPQLHVPLAWMEETSRFTKSDCERIAALYVVACQPWALATLCVGSLRLPYDLVARWLVPCLGVMTIARALVGSDYLVKAALGSTYLFARTPLMRDQIGAALRAKRTPPIVASALLATSALALVLLPSDRSGHTKTRKIEIFERFLLIVACSGAYALVVACVQGLPVTPAFKLTKLDGGLYITFVHHATCPCYAHLHECSDMHTRRKVIVIFLQDMISFVAILKGDEEANKY